MYPARCRPRSKRSSLSIFSTPFVRDGRSVGRQRTLLSADVSAVVEAAHRVAKAAGEPLPRSVPQLLLGDGDVDLVASVNLLSQLPCMPVGYLRRAGVHNQAAIDAFARDLIRAHLDYLRQLPGIVTLIADYESLTLNRNGEVLKKTSTVYDVPLPAQGEEWVWRLVPLARRPPYHSEWLKVAGIVDIHQSPCTNPPV